MTASDLGQSKNQTMEVTEDMWGNVGIEVLSNRWFVRSVRTSIPISLSTQPSFTVPSNLLLSHQYYSTSDRARYNEVNLHSCLK